MSDRMLRAVIDLDVKGPRISRHLYGHFAEHLGRCIYGGFWVGEDSDIPNERGIRLDVVEALRAIRVPNLRWPGGCFADDYHWRDGVGPRESRPRMVNSHWGDVVENNHFGTHEFMDLCQLLGADAYVNGNVGSGTVREMSEWVEYLTRGDDSPMSSLRRSHGQDEPWHVPFWGIGNEPWGCGGNMRAEAYADLARQYSTYLRNHGGNKLYRIAAGARDDDYSWTEALMKSLTCLGCGPDPQRLFEAISFHYYTIPLSWQERGLATVFDDAQYYRTMIQARRVDEIIGRHATVMDHYDPRKTIGLVLDEWGTWFDVEPGTNPGFLYQQNTMRDALVASVHFDAFHRHADRLVMANIAQTLNVLQAMILTDPETESLVLTPTYHVFEMNTGHHDAESLAVNFVGDIPCRSVDGMDLPVLSASASTSDNRALISVSNLDVEATQSVQFDLRGREVQDVRARILTADKPQSHNTPLAPTEVAPKDFPLTMNERGLAVEIPRHSYVAIELLLAPDGG